MSYKVILTSKFERELKRLTKKYNSLKVEYIDLVKGLTLQPVQGKQLGNNCYKIRLSIASKGKGKSGGARVVTCLYVKDEIVYLLSIYDKSERENISDSELQDLLSWIPTKD